MQESPFAWRATYDECVAGGGERATGPAGSRREGEESFFS